MGEMSKVEGSVDYLSFPYGILGNAMFGVKQW